MQISENFTYKQLLKYALPSIVMLVFTSIYMVVDGFFVSNYVGKTAFAAVNFIMPVIMIFGFVGFMFGSGGSALIAKTMGEGQSEKANQIFSLLIYTSIGLGVILSIVGVIFIRSIASALGAEGQMLEDCVTYGRIILMVLPATILQFEFNMLFAAAGKPMVGMYVIIAAGITNILLDWVLIILFPFGLKGAAVATAISQLVAAIVPLIYFSRKNSSLLQFTKTNFDTQVLLKTCTNGASELVTTLSMSIVGMLYNMQLLKLAGENGVAAYGVLMYVSLVFLTIFIGYSMGTAPIISYQFGAKNHTEVRSLLKKGMVIIAAFAVIMFSAAQLFAPLLSTLFVGYDLELVAMTERAFELYSFSFLFAGFAIFGSAFFTALNDGLTSGTISFLRTLVFETGAVFIFPIFWGIDGIWLSVVIAEMMAVIVVLLFLKINRHKYHY
ncbi:MATE family efflux transporter [Psychrobacter celer]|uniref:MATE family efflux transporter n=2 Tax=Psychrobacter celer TaxID=306572 RepID=UPI003FD6551B